MKQIVKEAFKDYKQTTFGALSIGDTFNVSVDAETSPEDLDFVMRVKAGETEAKYADGDPMFSPEDNTPAKHVVFVKRIKGHVTH